MKLQNVGSAFWAERKSRQLLHTPNPYNLLNRWTRGANRLELFTMRIPRNTTKPIQEK